jgi:hypothetical protein
MGAAAKQDDRPARLVAAGAAVLSGAVLADSALEHYRGSFRDPVMVAPLAAASALLAVTLRRAAGGRPAHDRVDTAAVLTGAFGLGFHYWNVTKRVGGLSLNNLLYAAPLGAPAALLIAGLSSRATTRLQRRGAAKRNERPGAGRTLAAALVVWILGTAGEAGLLHFRGAYHNPAMWGPVTLPPVAAMSLARDVIDNRPRRATHVLLAATAALGLLGAAFHGWGVHRNMGGWHNWRQNILAGPPIPAPPAFTGLALIGFAALTMMARRR